MQHLNFINFLRYCLTAQIFNFIIREIKDMVRITFAKLAVAVLLMAMGGGCVKC